MFDENKRQRTIEYFEKELSRKFLSKKFLKHFKCFQEMKDICLEMGLEICESSQGKFRPIATTYREAEFRFYENTIRDFTDVFINFSIIQAETGIPLPKVAEQYTNIISRAKREYGLKRLV